MRPFQWIPALFVLLSVAIPMVVTELFTSIAALERLIETEREVLTNLQTFRNRQLAEVNAVRGFVPKIRGEIEFWQESAGQKVSTHPVNAFHFIKRHSVDWHSLILTLTTDAIPSGDVISAIKQLQSTKQFPNAEDIKGAASAFQRLQAAYKLKAKDIANGQIPLTRRTPPFTAREAFLVGYKQANLTMHGSSVQWLEIAAEKYHTETRRTTNYVEILDWLQYSSWYYNNNASRALEISLEIKALNPTFANVNENLKHYTSRIVNMTTEMKAKMALPPQPYKELGEDDSYHALCRGELKVAANISAIQRCYYETYNNPYLLLQPVKTELFHLDPDVYLLHDVLLPSQMKAIQNVSFSHLRRARVNSVAGGAISDSRISQTAFLNESVSPVLVDVRINAGYITNLNSSHAELLQPNNYGTAGLYLPHFDYIQSIGRLNSTLSSQHLMDMGDRIATLMYYLSDVEAGGATVFPKLNLTIFPEKGAAAFWYNLYKDGMGDVRTLHSGCAVLAGSKWVANKWFRMNTQDVTRPCGLVKDSPDHVDVMPAPPVSETLVVPQNISS